MLHQQVALLKLFIKLWCFPWDDFGDTAIFLYINDLPNCLSNCEPRIYGDDIHLTCTGDNGGKIQLHLNQDLENVHNWLKANKLSLNMTETEFMLIGSRQRLSTLTESPTFAINDFQVIQVTTIKSLGVTMIGVATSRK